MSLKATKLNLRSVRYSNTVANVRKSPSKESEIVTQLSPGQVVECFKSSKENWLEIYALGNSVTLPYCYANSFSDTNSDGTYDVRDNNYFKGSYLDGFGSMLEGLPEGDPIGFVYEPLLTFTRPYDFKSFKWGESKSVIKIKDRIVEEMKTKDGFPALISIDTVLGNSCLGSYYFLKDKLVQGRMIFTPSFENYTEKLPVELIKTLTVKYGAPFIDSASNSSTWYTPRTFISLSLQRSLQSSSVFTNDINILIDYYSIEYYDAVTKAMRLKELKNL